MAKVDPFVIQWPEAWVRDPEIGPVVHYLNRFLYDLWLRSGGGVDDVNEVQLNEIFNNSVDDGSSIYVDKSRRVVDVSANYTVLYSDGIIRADASGGSITITLPKIDGIEGYEFTIKRTDSATTANTLTIAGDGSELIDGHAGGVDVYLLSSYTVKANATGWDII
tara:strand:- start:24240 stop:24734 length:495 start_codon:yes stop_codon:yes gene_type:complete